MWGDIWRRITFTPAMIAGETRGWAYPYITDFLLVPMIIAGTVWLDWHRQDIWIVPKVVFGLAIFTLAEYIVHRWLLHGVLFYGTHEHHHKHPHDYQVFTWWQLPLIYFLAACVMNPPVYVGFMVGVLWFLCWHHMLHHWSHEGRPWLALYDEWHDLHHKDLPVNYGITHGAKLWDFVFGTYMSTADGHAELRARAEADRLRKARIARYKKVRSCE